MAGIIFYLQEGAGELGLHDVAIIANIFRIGESFCLADVFSGIGTIQVDNGQWENGDILFLKHRDPVEGPNEI